MRHPRRVIIGIPVLLVGGTEMHTLSLVETLLDAGYRVTLCCYYEHTEEMVARFRALGAEVLLLQERRSDGLARLLRTLVRVFRQLKPDVVHVQYVAPGLLPIIAARVARVKAVVATVHIAGRHAYGLKAKLLLRTAALLCDAFVCVSRGVEEFWFGSSAEAGAEGSPGGRRHFTIYNCVDVTRIGEAVSASNRHELRKSLGVEGNATVGIVGRLGEQKGLAVLLRALPSVIERVPTTKVLVVGDGPEREALRRQAADMGMSGNVSWIGRKSPRDVYPLYGVMDVLAVPSLYEGFGLVAAEAMAAGVPVVASNVEGLSEVVEHDVTGLLVPPGNPEALAEGLVAVLLDRERARRMSDRGRARVAQRFSRERFDRGVLSAYRSILD